MSYTLHGRCTKAKNGLRVILHLQYLLVDDTSHICSKATILKKDKYTTTYRLYYTKQNLTSAKNSAIGLVGVFGPGSKAFKVVFSLSGANANPTSGIIMDVRYPNSFKGGGTVLKTQKWNK